MTQHSALIALFREHGGSVTLGQIMQTNLAAEYRARISEARRMGYQFILERRTRPSENTYHMVEPPAFDPAGQGILFETEKVNLRGH